MTYILMGGPTLIHAAYSGSSIFPVRVLLKGLADIEELPDQEVTFEMSLTPEEAHAFTMGMQSAISASVQVGS